MSQPHQPDLTDLSQDSAYLPIWLFDEMNVEPPKKRAASGLAVAMAVVALIAALLAVAGVVFLFIRSMDNPQATEVTQIQNDVATLHRDLDAMPERMSALIKDGINDAMLTLTPAPVVSAIEPTPSLAGALQIVSMEENGRAFTYLGDTAGVALLLNWTRDEAPPLMDVSVDHGGLRVISQDEARPDCSTSSEVLAVSQPLTLLGDQKSGVVIYCPPDSNATSATITATTADGAEPVGELVLTLRRDSLSASLEQPLFQTAESAGCIISDFANNNRIPFALTLNSIDQTPVERHYMLTVSGWNEGELRLVQNDCSSAQPLAPGVPVPILLSEKISFDFMPAQDQRVLPTFSATVQGVSATISLRPILYFQGAGTATPPNIRTAASTSAGVIPNGGVNFIAVVNEINGEWVRFQLSLPDVLSPGDAWVNFAENGGTVRLVPPSPEPSSLVAGP